MCLIDSVGSAVLRRLYARTRGVADELFCGPLKSGICFLCGVTIAGQLADCKKRRGGEESRWRHVGGLFETSKRKFFGTCLL